MELQWKLIYPKPMPSFACRALGDLSTFGQVARTPQRATPAFSLFSPLGSTTPPSANSDILQRWYAYKDTQTQSARVRNLYRRDPSKHVCI